MKEEIIFFLNDFLPSFHLSILRVPPTLFQPLFFFLYELNSDKYVSKSGQITLKVKKDEFALSGG